jgi:prepilin-type N-terminal cleavage/methylation domain-containing protein
MARRRPIGPQLRAFTLVELILVMLLISTALAIASPSLRGFTRGRQASNAAGRVLALTHLARSLASAAGEPYRLCTSADGTACWLEHQEAGAYVAVQEGPGHRLELPEGLTVRVSTLQEVTPHLGGDDAAAGRPGLGLSAPGGGAGDAGGYVQFDPDGRADVAVLEVQDQTGQVLRVANPSPGERFHIVSQPENGRS